MRLSAFALLMATCMPCFALSVPVPVDRNLQDQQQKRMLDQAREQRESLDQQRQTSPAPARRASPDDAAPADGPCMEVRDVEFRGAALVPASLKEQISAQAAGHCLGKVAVARMLDEINDWYVANGYITSHAWLPPQNSADPGHMIIAAVEGRTASVKFSGGDNAANRTARTAFAGMTGNPLNLRDIEQGVEQIERVARDGVQVAVRAAPIEGYSDVVLSGDVSPALHAAFSLDNTGQESTGKDQAGAILSLNNGLGLAEQLSLSATSTMPVDGDRFRRNYGASAVLPVGPWTFSYSGSVGDYAIPFAIDDFTLSYHGHTVSHRVEASRILSRNGRQKTDGFLAFSHYTGNTYLDEFRLDYSSERVAAVQAGINFATRLGSKSYLTLGPKLTQSIPHYTADLSAGGGAPADFRKAALSASLYTQISPRLSWLSSAYGQWSRSPLFGSERVSIGGDTSVRGFRDAYLFGDTGAYLRNELNWTSPAPWGQGNVALTVALDAGRVVPVEGEPRSGGNVVGAALGVSASYRRLNASLSIGTPLWAPTQLNADPFVLSAQLSLAL
ncbi:ShlB/FhaC/HecB family hemolysin secretion/activation protein [Cupriavidus pauculus]|jgi:hemolysin activation/secretion protein|uniref:ShlB/FhaC/HecB family hemolysin secretion/activation protein n=1 Tax=Cupriavidus pauculus TaxID=82633 RepID=UPI0030F813B7